MMKRLIMAHRCDPRFRHAVISLRGLGTVGPDLLAEGIEVEALGLDRPWQLPGRLIRLAALISAMRPQVVQTWMYHADLFAGLAARAVGVRGIVWNVRISEVDPRYGIARTTGWIRSICARVSGIIPQRIVYVAESARETHEAAGYDAAKSVVIPNGYSLPPAATERGRIVGADGHDWPQDALLVVSAGRFNPQKNHRSFVMACGSIGAKHPSAHFVMCGDRVTWDNPDLAGWIAQTGISDRFHLLGERSDFLTLLPSFDILCLHSLAEGFPNVVAEAMAAGIPCVATDVGDAAALIGDTGWIVPPADDARLADALDAALSLDETHRCAYGARARRQIESNYSMSFIAERYAALYLDVALRQPARLASC